MPSSSTSGPAVRAQGQGTAKALVPAKSALFKENGPLGKEAKEAAFPAKPGAWCENNLLERDHSGGTNLRSLGKNQAPGFEHLGLSGT